MFFRKLSDKAWQSSALALGLSRSPLASELVALEPRMVFDGAAAATAAAVADHAADHHADASADHADGADKAAQDSLAKIAAALEPHASGPAEPARAPAPREIVVIDARVADPAAFAAAAGPNRTVITVGADEDGLAAITRALAAEKAPVSAVHVIGHGRAGEATLGRTSLDSAEIERDAAMLRGWQDRLSAGADILLYGCDVGAGEGGAALVAALARTTGADVAASTNRTGNTQGADWTLERQTGTIEARILDPRDWAHDLPDAGNPPPATKDQASAALGGVDTSGLRVWLDASKLTGKTGDAVTQWNNLARAAGMGGGDNVDPALRKVTPTGDAPTLVSDRNGAGVSFSGNARFQFANSGWFNGAVTMFVIADPRTQDANGKTFANPTLVSNGTANTSQVGRSLSVVTNSTTDTADDRFALFQSDAVNGAASYLDLGAKVYGKQLLTARFAGSGDSVTATLNSSATAQSGSADASSNSDRSDLFIGGAGANGNLFTGTIREVVIFDRALSDAECQIVEAALATKWGLKTENVPTPWAPANVEIADVGGIARSGIDGYRTGANGGLGMDGAGVLKSGGDLMLWAHKASDTALGWVESNGIKSLNRSWYVSSHVDKTGFVSVSVDLPDGTTEADVGKMRLLWKGSNDQTFSVLSANTPELRDGKIVFSGVLVKGSSTGSDPVGAWSAMGGDGELTIAIAAQERPTVGLAEGTGTNVEAVTTNNADPAFTISNHDPRKTYWISTDKTNWTQVSATFKPGLTGVGVKGFYLAATADGTKPSGITGATPFAYRIVAAGGISIDVKAPYGSDKNVDTVVKDGKISFKEYVANKPRAAWQAIADVKPDGGGGPYTYELTKTVTGGMDGVDYDWFQIDQVTGEIEVVPGKVPNFEQMDGVTYTLTITVTDVLGNKAEKTLTVELVDQNDRPILTVADPTGADLPARNPDGSVNYWFAAKDTPAAAKDKIVLDLFDEDELVEKGKAGLRDQFVSSLRLSTWTGSFELADGYNKTLLDNSKTIRFSGFGTQDIVLVGKLADLKAALQYITLKTYGQIGSTQSPTTSLVGVVNYELNDLGNSMSGDDVSRVWAITDFLSFSNGRPLIDAASVKLGQDSFPGSAPDTFVRGVQVSSLFGPKGAGLGTPQNMSDPEGFKAGTEFGIAVTDVTGEWYWRSGTGPWTKIAVSSGSALLLDAGAELYCATDPAGKTGADAPRLAVRAWDKSSGAAGEAKAVAELGIAVSEGEARLEAAWNSKPELTTPKATVTITHPSAKEGSTWPDPVAAANGSSLIGGSVDDLLKQAGWSDKDAPGLRGIAVTGFTNAAGGAWWFTTDKGATWQKLADLVKNNQTALLLAAGDQTRLFYVGPMPADASKAPTITFRAWDPSGQGGVVSKATLANGSIVSADALNSRAFSADEAKAVYKVLETPKDPPANGTINYPAPGTDPYAPVNAAPGVGAGMSLKDLARSLGYGDADGIGLAVWSPVNARVFVSQDGGARWTMVWSTHPSLLVTNGDMSRIAILPGTGAAASPVRFSVYAWNPSVLLQGPAVNELDYKAPNDPATPDQQRVLDWMNAALSKNAASVTVKFVDLAGKEVPILNNRPILDVSDPKDRIYVFKSQPMSSPPPSPKTEGRTVGDLINPQFFQWKAGDAPLKDFSVVDRNGGQAGIAITGVVKDAQGNFAGTLWYRTTPTAAWRSVDPATLSEKNALLLNQNAQIYFVPTATSVGTVDAVTFRAWDQTNRTVVGNNGQFADVSKYQNNASSPFSADSDVLRQVITGINKAPDVALTPEGNPLEFKEGATVWLDLWKDAKIDVQPGESNTTQQVLQMDITVTGLRDGASEQLKLDGTAIDLVNGNKGTTSGNLKLSYSVTLDSTGKAVLTLWKTDPQGNPTTFSPADAATLLDDAAYRNTSENPTGGAGNTRTVALTRVQDNGGTQPSGNEKGKDTASGEFGLLKIEVVPTPDAPGVDVLDTPTDANQAGTAVPVAPGLTLTNVDGTLPSQVEVTLAGPRPGENLAFAGNKDLFDTKLTEVTDPSTGKATLKLTITAKPGKTLDLAQWQDALKSVTYQYTSTDPIAFPDPAKLDPLRREVTFAVKVIRNDTVVSSSQAVKKVDVNRMPTIAAGEPGDTVASGVNPGNDRFDGTPTSSITLTLKDPEKPNDPAAVSFDGTLMTKPQDQGGGGWNMETRAGKQVYVKQGTYGEAVIDIAARTLTYTLDNKLPAMQALYQGQNVTQDFTIFVVDKPGATAKTAVTFTIVGTNKAPVVTDVPATGGFIEFENTTGSTVTRSVDGTVDFGDVNLPDTHEVSKSGPSFAWKSGSTTLTLTDQQKQALAAASTFDVSITKDSTGTGKGSVGWTYSAPDKAFDFLKAGETLTITYKVTVKDNHNATVEKDVVVTVTGTNDQPTVEVGEQKPSELKADGLAPDGKPTPGVPNASIALTLRDPDGDKVTYDADAMQKAGWVESTQSGTTFWTKTGTFGTAVLDASTNTITYTLDNKDSDTLALSQGQQASDAFKVFVKDGQGGTASADVAFALVGTNKAPVITGGTWSGGFTELPDTTGSEKLQTATGTGDFGDVNLNDTHTVSDARPTFLWKSGSATLNLTEAQKQALADASTLALSLTPSAGTGKGKVAWTYSAPDKTFDFLKAGETLTITYKVTVKDNHGATAEQDIEITIFGANDSAVGTVTIAGLPQVGQTLTAVADITDPDGFEGPLDYQWYRNGAAIPGATGQTYVVQGIDAGTFLSVVASFTDKGGTRESVASEGVPVGAPAVQDSIVIPTGRQPGFTPTPVGPAPLVSLPDTGFTFFGGLLGSGSVSVVTVNARGEPLGAEVTGAAGPEVEGRIVSIGTFKRGPGVEITVDLFGPRRDDQRAPEEVVALAATVDESAGETVAVAGRRVVYVGPGAGLVRVELTVTAPDGSLVRTAVVVDTATGRVERIEPATPLAAAPRFDELVMAEVAGTAAEAARLAADLPVFIDPSFGFVYDSSRL